VRTLPASQAKRAHRAGGHQCGLLIATAHRPQQGIDPQPLSRSDVHRVDAGLRAGRRRPCVRESGRGTGAIRGSPRPERWTPSSPNRARSVTDAAEAQVPGVRGQRDVHGDHHEQQRKQNSEGRCGPGDTPIGSTQISAIRPARPVSATSAVPEPRPGCRPTRRRGWRPRARPPCRRAIRCRNVGRAIALTSSGVT